MITIRPQVLIPRAHEIGDTATVVIRRQNGDLETYNIPWTKRGTPILSAGSVLSPHAFVVRYFAGDADRLLVVNLGPDQQLDIAPEPLLAPLDLARGWRRLWHSEDPCYGGLGAAQLESENGSWRIPAESATLLAADVE